MIKLMSLQATLSATAFQVATWIFARNQKEVFVPEILYKFRLSRKEWLIVSRELRKNGIIQYNHNLGKLIFKYMS